MAGLLVKVGGTPVPMPPHEFLHRVQIFKPVQLRLARYARAASRILSPGQLSSGRPWLWV
jgi:hypothetical protein